MKNVCENMYRFSKSIQALDLDKSNISKYILILTKYVNENCDSILELISCFDRITDGDLITSTLNFFYLVITLIKNLSDKLIRRSTYDMYQFSMLTENTLQKFSRA